MRHPNEFIGGGALDGLYWVAGRNHGDVFIALDRQRSRYIWDAYSLAWRHAGWLAKPLYVAVDMSKLYPEGTIGHDIEFRPEPNDPYQDQ